MRARPMAVTTLVRQAMLTVSKQGGKGERGGFLVLRNQQRSILSITVGGLRAREAPRRRGPLARNPAGGAVAARTASRRLGHQSGGPNMCIPAGEEGAQAS